MYIYIYVYIIINTPYRSKFLDAFKKGVSYAHQGGIYLIKNTVKSVILWNIITIQKNWFQFEYIKKNVVYFCDAKLYFQHHYASLQCHVILQKSF